MKKSIIVALISVLVLFIVGCEQRPSPIHFENLPTFSYENDLISYSDNSLTVKKRWICKFNRIGKSNSLGHRCSRMGGKGMPD